MKRCKNCRYNHSENMKDRYGNSVGLICECRRYAPRMIAGADNSTGLASWEFPAVSPDSWCGEWRCKESEDA